MPSLPLPPLEGGVPIGAGDLPVNSIDDVQAEWSTDITRLPSAPVASAIQQGQLAALLKYQALTRYAAAQSDPLRATGEYLEEIGWERGVYKAAGESDTSYSPRVNARPSTVDPNDIIAAANAVLAPYTGVSCRYAEHLDGLFLSNPSTTTWSNHLFNDGRLTGGSWSAPYGGGPFAVPNYPDRYYTAIPNRRPQGALLFNSYGRLFVLRVPDIGFVDNTVSGLYQEKLVTIDPGQGTTLHLGRPSTTVLRGAINNSATSITVASPSSLAMPSGGINIAIDGELMAVTGGSGNNLTVVRGLLGTAAAAHKDGATIFLAPYPFDPPTGLTDGNYGLFLGDPADGASAKNVAFLWSFDATTAGVYQSVANAVEALRGHSIRWSLMSDPNLI